MVRPALILAVLLLFCGRALASGPPETVDAAALFAVYEGERAVFRIGMEDLERFSPTRARRGAPMLALYLTDDAAARYEGFVTRFHGARLWVATCGELLGRRRVVEPEMSGRIGVIFMETDRSRAYLAALEAGGCPAR